MARGLGGGRGADLHGEEARRGEDAGGGALGWRGGCHGHWVDEWHCRVVGGGEEVWEMGKGKVEIRVSCLGMDGWIHVARARWGGP